MPVNLDTMRVRFKVEKNLGKHPNKASVTITNLALETIASRKPDSGGGL